MKVWRHPSAGLPQRSMELRIKGRLPGLNEYIAAERTNRYKAAQMKREAEALVLWSAKASIRGKIPTPCVMHYTWVEPNKKRDMDNISSFGRKVIQDALVKGGYLPGDGWKYIHGFTDSFEVGDPGVKVVCKEVT